MSVAWGRDKQALFQSPAFADAGLKRILRAPWETTRKVSALACPIEKQRDSRLTAVTATRFTVADKQIFRELAKKHRTTLAGMQRQRVEGTLTKEAPK